MTNEPNKPKQNHDDEFVREHPSYGMLHIFRMGSGGSRRLFGSSLASHYQTVRITISKAKWYHRLSEDRYHGMGKEFIEIELSAAQFADAITSLNIGSGTPCTIRYLNMKAVDEPPDHKTEVEHVKSTFRDKLAMYIDRIKENSAEIRDTIKPLSDKAQKKVASALDQILMQIQSNIPFIVDQFQEAAERVQTAAKAEIEAFATGVLRAAGMEAIAQGRLPNLLGGGEGNRE